MRESQKDFERSILRWRKMGGESLLHVFKMSINVLFPTVTFRMVVCVRCDRIMVDVLRMLNAFKFSRY